MRQALTVGVILWSLGAAGCGSRQWHHWALHDVGVALPDLRTDDRVTRRAGTASEPLEIMTGGGGQTVLIAYETYDNPQRTDEEWGRAYVVVLDGPPAEGRFEVTPENGRFIEHSAFRPARRPYVGLDGHVRILSVESDGDVVAHCVLRSYLRDDRDPGHVFRGTVQFDTPREVSRFLNGPGIRLE